MAAKKKPKAYEVVAPVPGIVGDTTFHNVGEVVSAENPDVVRAVAAHPDCFAER